MSQHHSTPFPIRVSGRICAVARGKTLDIRRHENGILRVPPAIAVGEQVLMQGESLRCDNLAVTVIETGRVYALTIANFKRHGFRIKRSGWESQIACGLEYWQIANEGRAPLSPEAPPAHPRSGPLQLSMFGGAS